LAVAVWLWCLGVVVIAAADQDRLDDELMLAVAKMQLKDDPDIRCVRGLRHDGSFGPVSDWLLQRLRRHRQSLTRCIGDGPGNDIATELWLGPVIWPQGSSDATVYWEFPMLYLVSPCIPRTGAALVVGISCQWFGSRRKTLDLHARLAVTNAPSFQPTTLRM
jgi:hypothetical protein